MNWVQKNRLVILAVAVLAVVVVYVTLPGRGVIPIRAEDPVRETIMNSISTNGKVEPVQNFQAYALGPALVNQVLVKEGDHVKAGQLLVRLDDANARALAASAIAKLRAAESALGSVKKGGTQEEVLTNESNLIKAKADLDNAKRNLDALKNLQQRGAASAGEVETAQNRLQQAQADVSLLESKQTGRYSNPEIAKVQAEAEEARAAHDAAVNVLRHSNVASTVSGTVYALPVREGAFVNGGDLIVQVADLTKVQVRAFVDEPEIGKLSNGEKVTVTWDAVPGRVWKGSVIRVPSAVVIKGTRTVGEVVSKVENADRTLLPNVNVNVIISAAMQENALTVSREAVIEENGSRFVYKIVEGHLQKQVVKTGISNLTKIQILEGLTEKTPVAVGSVNSQPLSDKAAVKIVER